VLQTAGEKTFRSIEPSANEIIEGLKALEPRDPVDGMLGVLMVSCYQSAMESLTISRSLGQDRYVAASAFDSQPSRRAVNLAQAGQLMRTFAQLVETRDRRRASAVANINANVSADNPPPSVTIHRIIVERPAGGRDDSRRHWNG
jgi:hypothetical protein